LPCSTRSSSDRRAVKLSRLRTGLENMAKPREEKSFKSAGDDASWAIMGGDSNVFGCRTACVCVWVCVGVCGCVGVCVRACGGGGGGCLGVYACVCVRTRARVPQNLQQLVRLERGCSMGGHYKHAHFFQGLPTRLHTGTG